MPPRPRHNGAMTTTQTQIHNGANSTWQRLKGHATTAQSAANRGRKTKRKSPQNGTTMQHPGNENNRNKAHNSPDANQNASHENQANYRKHFVVFFLIRQLPRLHKKQCAKQLTKHQKISRQSKKYPQKIAPSVLFCYLCKMKEEYPIFFWHNLCP